MLKYVKLLMVGFLQCIPLHPLQGSGIGPTLWIAMASDLCCISDMNSLFKYADDTNLLVPENTNVDLVDEFSNIQEWADSIQP